MIKDKKICVCENIIIDSGYTLDNIKKTKEAESSIFISNHDGDISYDHVYLTDTYVIEGFHCRVSMSFINNTIYLLSLSNPADRSNYYTEGLSEDQEEFGKKCMQYLESCFQQVPPLYEDEVKINVEFDPHYGTWSIIVVFLDIKQYLM